MIRPLHWHLQALTGCLPVHLTITGFLWLIVLEVSQKRKAWVGFDHEAVSELGGIRSHNLWVAVATLYPLCHQPLNDAHSRFRLFLFYPPKWDICIYVNICIMHLGTFERWTSVSKVKQHPTTWDLNREPLAYKSDDYTITLAPSGFH